MIDIYGHIGLPRFGSAEEFLVQMDAHGVDQALLSTAQFCPDVVELARAGHSYPDRFRIVGLPVGSNPAQRCQVVEKQLESGFSGIRIPATEVLDNPGLLEIVGRYRAFLLVVAFEPWTRFEPALSGFLDRYPDSFIIGGHFAGVADPSLIRTGGPLHALYTHPRFHVAFTRQGLMDRKALDPWARTLIDVLGWDHLLWGSEWPVAIWRNESYDDTVRFVDAYAPTEDQRKAFFSGNARRILFDRPALQVTPIDEVDAVMRLKAQGRIHLLPQGMDVSEEQHLALMRAFLANGQASRTTYRDYLQGLLLRGLEASRGNS